MDCSSDRKNQKILMNFARIKHVLDDEDAKVVKEVVEVAGRNHEDCRHRHSPNRRNWPIVMFGDVATFLHQRAGYIC